MNPMPKHVAIVLDGNRRFARRIMAKPWKGHEWGAKKVEELLTWCKDFDIRELTLYTFSLENFKRPKREFDYLMRLFVESFEKVRDDPRIEEHDIRLNFIGRISLFPQEMQDIMRELMEKTKKHDCHIINFAMAYGGRAEIVDAARKMAEDLEAGKLSSADVSEQTFRRYLYLTDEPDVIIRTGGEKRTSNFLMWQSPYSEWFFLEKAWPEFTKEDFAGVLKEYVKRERRFGA